MTGHAPPSATQRLLRTAGADAQAIRGLENFRCSVCEAKKVPDRPSPVKMPEEYNFNKAISLDVFVIKDAMNKKYKVMSVVVFEPFSMQQSLSEKAVDHQVPEKRPRR